MRDREGSPTVKTHFAIVDYRFWLRDESIEDASNLPEPDVIAGEILEDLQAALDQLEAIQMDLSSVAVPEAS